MPLSQFEGVLVTVVEQDVTYGLYNCGLYVVGSMLLASKLCAIVGEHLCPCGSLSN